LQCEFLTEGEGDYVGAGRSFMGASAHRRSREAHAS
jgi:hypothetical protein